MQHHHHDRTEAVARSEQEASPLLWSSFRRRDEKGEGKAVLPVLVCRGRMLGWGEMICTRM